MKIAFIPATALLAIAACAPSIDPNAVSFTRDGNRFTGQAGAEISIDELQEDRLYGLCPSDDDVRELQITRRSNGSVGFTGRCA